MTSRSRPCGATTAPTVPVDQCWGRVPGPPAERRHLPGHGAGAAQFGAAPGGQQRGVGPPHHVRGQHGQQGGQVALAGGGQEGLHHRPLPVQFRGRHRGHGRGPGAGPGWPASWPPPLLRLRIGAIWPTHARTGRAARTRPVGRAPACPVPRAWARPTESMSTASLLGAAPGVGCGQPGVQRLLTPGGPGAQHVQADLVTPWSAATPRGWWMSPVSLRLSRNQAS